MLVPMTRMSSLMRIISRVVTSMPLVKTMMLR